tara:strand:- start:1354 stop:1596 length:243 start_codon:yes stop_codon:yes gene_type:complete
MSKKLKKSELELLQNSVNTLNNLQIQVGGLEGQKHELLHSMSKAKEDLGVIQKELEDRYGQVSVDIKTGEIKSNEPDTKD